MNTPDMFTGFGAQTDNPHLRYRQSVAPVREGFGAQTDNPHSEWFGATPEFPRTTEANV
jgi:hypothetical protein